ncbi:hypothetical protein BO94DRAFT_594537 [Aspergillus sclerotioniger CBS 115572]|uniref:Uncharacterized protein n=1 Tax=Aspergillus sclerotioniger CBS 115572 TaxID=1450535 RepID=A0A317WV39_9EURO|nr:hypothetical protein BO94DRAFT_594537 [Aspergillus sclerotioniger CBS 115572]PWY89681.1 hypothetical protein BO94DRAFT_594537 [Aspergillus sclerotioniger CBS 115572]
MSRPVHCQNVTAAAPAEERVGWVSPPTTRGTSDILFSCLSVFIICSWKCVHLNIPSIEESEAGCHTAWGWLPFWPTAPLRRLWGRKLRWMALIAIAPEIGIAVAFKDFMKAREIFKEYQHLGFTMTHAFYACMGGYRIAIPQALRHRDGAAHNNELPTSGAAPVEALEGGPAPGHSLPLVKEEDIRNASASDAITKGLAILQCGWLVIQSIARAAAGLPLTELELMTLAFIPCALVMYGLWWDKPFGVQRATLIYPLDPKNARALHDRLGLSNRLARSARNEDGAQSFQVLLEFYFSVWSMRDHVYWDSVICNITSIVFSVFHLIAWNWEFPSKTVKILWRVFSVTATGAPVVLVTTPSLLSCTSLWSSGVWRALGTFIVVSFGLGWVYIIARVSLIVLVFYCFSSMPADVYKAVQWTAIFPHFS